MVHRVTALLGLATALLSAANMTAVAGKTAPPKGAVILTVSGAIGNWNRSAYDERRDTFLKHHEITFDKAMVFDRAALAALEQGSVKARPPQLAKTGTFTGPKLAAVLQAVGAKPDAKVWLMALDGFAASLNAATVRAKDWIVATAVDGKPLALGGQGPIWVLHTPKDAPKVSDEEEAQWPWAVFYMRIE